MYSTSVDEEPPERLQQRAKNLHLSIVGETMKARMGRPPKEDRDSLLRERLVIMVTAEMKERILERGGAEYIRRLVEADGREHDSTDGIPSLRH